MSGDKKKRKPKKPVNTWKFYSKKGDTVEKTRKACPKCGAGVFMAQHKDRVCCGKCQYTEFTSKK